MEYKVLDKTGKIVFTGTSREVKAFVGMSQKTSLSVYTLGRKWYREHLIVPQDEFEEFMSGWDDYIASMRARYKKKFS